MNPGEVWESNGTAGADRVVLVLERRDEEVTFVYLYHAERAAVFGRKRRWMLDELQQTYRRIA